MVIILGCLCTEGLLQESVGGQSGGNRGRQLRHLPLQLSPLTIPFSQLLTQHTHLCGTMKRGVRFQLYRPIENYFHCVYN